jgi:hypothetical protein
MILELIKELSVLGMIAGLIIAVFEIYGGQNA